MGLLKILIINVIIAASFYLVSVSAQNKWDPRKRDDCRDNVCGGEAKWHKDVEKEDSVCYTLDRIGNFGGYNEYETTCVAKCMGLKPHPDQLKCWCERCKFEETGGASGFCTQIGDTVKQEECDEKVCSGKYPFKGNGCYWMGED